MATVEQIGKYYYVRLKNGFLHPNRAGRAKRFIKHSSAIREADEINKSEREQSVS